MNSDEKSSEEKSPTLESLDGFNSRELSLLRHYLDPTSPGYRNGTKSAELAGYQGEPGSNQLAVQANRTLAKARRLGVLRLTLDVNGCSLEDAAKTLAACMKAKRQPVAITKAGVFVEGPEQDDHRVQLDTAKFVFRLHGAVDTPRRRQQLPPAAACDDGEPRPERQEPTSPEHQNAIAILSESDPVSRDALRDVVECDAKLHEFEAHEPQLGTAKQSGQGAKGDPNQA